MKLFYAPLISTTTRRDTQNRSLAVAARGLGAVAIVLTFCPHRALGAPVLTLRASTS